MLASFYSNFCTCSSLAMKNWEPYADSLGGIRVKPDSNDKMKQK